MAFEALPVDDVVEQGADPMPCRFTGAQAVHVEPEAYQEELPGGLHSSAVSYQVAIPAIWTEGPEVAHCGQRAHLLFRERPAREGRL